MQKKSRSLNAESTASRCLVPIAPRQPPTATAYPARAVGRPTSSRSSISRRRTAGPAPPQRRVRHRRGVSRIFDVWQTREDGERFMTERLEPIESMIAAATESGENFAPPAREGWYELHHDTMSG